MGNLMTAFAYDGEQGVLEPRQTISTLPDDFTDFSTAAEVAVSPDGRFVFGSNRGHDSIVTYAVDENAGTLSPVGWASAQGRTPRHFTLDPSGPFLYAENQDSDTVVTLRVDPETGQLTPTGHALETGSPVCIAFLDA
jgi:6-phosphogluconolactonase (cycloisomerase 2 family)